MGERGQESIESQQARLVSISESSDFIKCEKNFWLIYSPPPPKGSCSIIDLLSLSITYFEEIAPWIISPNYDTETIRKSKFLCRCPQLYTKLSISGESTNLLANTQASEQCSGFGEIPYIVVRRPSVSLVFLSHFLTDPVLYRQLANLHLLGFLSENLITENMEEWPRRRKEQAVCREALSQGGQVAWSLLAGNLYWLNCRTV